MREGALMPRGGGGARFGAALVPTAAAVDDRDHGQHDRDLDQNPDHGGKGGARIEAEKADSRGNGQLEEVAGADQGGRSGNTMLLTRHPVKHISEAGVEIDLDQDRYGEQADNQRLRQNLLALETEQHDQRRQELSLIHISEPTRPY